MHYAVVATVNLNIVATLLSMSVAWISLVLYTNSMFPVQL